MPNKNQKIILAALVGMIILITTVMLVNNYRHKVKKANVTSIDSLLYFRDKANSARDSVQFYYQRYEAYNQAYNSNPDSSERAKLGARILANAQDSLRARTVR